MHEAGGWSIVQKDSRETISPQEKTSGTDWYSTKVTGIGLQGTGVKLFSLMNPLSNCLGHPEKKNLSREEKVSPAISPVSCQQ